MKFKYIPATQIDPHPSLVEAGGGTDAPRNRCAAFFPPWPSPDPVRACHARRRAADAQVFARARRGEEQMRRPTAPDGRTGEREQMRRGTGPGLPSGAARQQGHRGTDAPLHRVAGREGTDAPSDRAGALSRPSAGRRCGTDVPPPSPRPTGYRRKGTDAPHSAAGAPWRRQPRGTDAPRNWHAAIASPGRQPRGYSPAP